MAVNKLEIVTLAIIAHLDKCFHVNSNRSKWTHSDISNEFCLWLYMPKILLNANYSTG